MTLRDERDRVRRIAHRYATAELAGANEQYHLYLRDATIPESGGASALELGCGKGLWSKVLAGRYDELDVVDGSADLLEAVTRENAGCRAQLRTHESLIEEFDPEGRRWEHIYLTFLLEHLDDPSEALRQVSQWLAPGGALFVAVPNADSVHRVVAVRMGLIDSTDELSANDLKVGHRRVYTPALLRSHIEESGLKLKELRGIGLKPLSLGQMKSWSTELVWGFCVSGDLSPDHAAYLVAEVTHPSD